MGFYGSVHYLGFPSLGGGVHGGCVSFLTLSHTLEIIHLSRGVSGSTVLASGGTAHCGKGTWGSKTHRGLGSQRKEEEGARVPHPCQEHPLQ